MLSSSRRKGAGSTWAPRCTTAWPRSPSPTPAWASHRRIRRRSSRSSGRWGRRTKRSRGPGSGWPCHASSSSCMGDGFGSRASQEKGRRSRSPSRLAMANELILIVEDNPKNLKLLRDTLQVKGYHTIEAETGEEGVQVARERHPALILMDIQLPGMSGIEALRELRVDPTTRAIPVIAVTASAMARTAHLGLPLVFYEEHRRRGDLDSDVAGERPDQWRVWIECH